MPPHARVVAGSGSQALIQALPRITPPADAAILGPTYGEHARAWAAAGHRVREIGRLDEAGDATVVVAVNPNNPDGRIIAPGQLLDLAARLAARGGLLVVDEAFCDERPDLSLTAATRPGLVVLRSFGKFFGLAGLRLGFAVAAEEMADRLAAHLGPWPVSGPALGIGAAALADEAWSAATIARLSDAAARLDAILGGAGLEVAGGTFLFRLARHDHAAELYERLGRAGILVRAFAFRSDILRIGLLGDAAAERRLGTALGG
ncbi:histidinol-phosphate/aromatic aminotransferase and cobyric acid decarboxylase [Paramagnetospirillum caucaseum]|uniref:Aminotransferase n=1 Tax=Paramagnetospirillum caucaseum TaxID=1244869 RepID=M2Z282_9PROT|nr:histidinol-phosphate/aromatic aminotransferase and cobyric acid decarboxylase [Paramagnetospirillum caucaseum]